MPPQRKQTLDHIPAWSRAAQKALRGVTGGPKTTVLVGCKYDLFADMDPKVKKITILTVRCCCVLLCSVVLRWSGVASLIG